MVLVVQGVYCRQNSGEGGHRDVLKQVSMSRKFHNHRPQTNLRHHEKETYSNINHTSVRTQLKAATSPLFLGEMIEGLNSGVGGFMVWCSRMGVL